MFRFLRSAIALLAPSALYKKASAIYARLKQGLESPHLHIRFDLSSFDCNVQIHFSVPHTFTCIHHFA